MQLSDYLALLKRYWVSILICATIGVSAAAAFCAYQQPTYTAAASVFLTVDAGNTAIELQQGSTYAENQVKSYAQVAAMPIVLDPVIENLGLQTTAEQLAPNISTAVPSGTAIIHIEVTGGDAERTAQLANAVSNQLLIAVQALSGRAADGSDTVVATVVAPAAVPADPTSPRAAIILAIGAIAGLTLGLAQAMTRRRLDNRVVSGEDVQEMSGPSVIGSIGLDRGRPARPMLERGTFSARAEEFRRLRTNIQFLNFENVSGPIVITSSLIGEGKTFTAINIASTLADAGQSVLLVDCDLRRPAVAGALGLEQAAGLTTVILGRASLSEVVQPIGKGNLHVLTCGQLPPNPSELLGSEAMSRLLREVSDQYELVILDSPPLLPVTDAAILARHCAGALVVVGSGEVRRPELSAALEAIRNAGGKVLGVVLNKVKSERRPRQAYYYYRGGSDENPPDRGELRQMPVERAGARFEPTTPEQVPSRASAGH